MAGKYNLLIEQGTTFEPSFTWYPDASDNGDGTFTNGDPMDLTGFTAARMQIRSSVPSSTVLFELTEGDGITLGDAAGTIALFISDTDTAAFDWDRGVYDLELVSGGGIVTRLLEGKVKVSPEVTR